MTCVAILLITGCSKPVETPPSVAIQYEISPEPPRVGLETVTFRLTDADAGPVTRAHIAIEADMSHAGMSPQFAEAKEAEPGSYQAHLPFEMAGDWVILLHVTLSSGKKLEHQIDVKGVRPN